LHDFDHALAGDALALARCALRMAKIWSCLRRRVMLSSCKARAASINSVGDLDLSSVRLMDMGKSC